MKKLLSATILAALLCGHVGAIGIEWSVDALYLENASGSQALADADTYGTTPLTQYVLRLVYIGDNTLANVSYGTFQNVTPQTVVSTGTLGTMPDDAGYVFGDANATQAGNYVLLLYNNHGGYYALSDTVGGAASSASIINITQDQADNPIAQPIEWTVASNVYRGALVPEPGTAALALAGLALLIRRRK
ncbi:MAG: PEP-CTERM sorting domain-containing protein [Kiritimatiellia bacterium]|jgi:hypothetical protein